MRAFAVAVVVMFATTAHASKPIPWTMKGCVLAGVFYSVDKDSASIVKTMRSDKPPLDLSKLEGKRIEVAGLLYPGDWFAPGDAPPAAKGDCTAADKKLVEYAKAHELRMKAGSALGDGRVDDSLKLVEEAIKLVQPADCDIYIDRAQLFAMKSDLKAAQKDLATLKAKKCRFRGALNWLLLQELAAHLREKNGHKLAVQALELAVQNCNSDICSTELKRDLADAKKAAATSK